MRRPQLIVPPVEPCDAIALDAFEQLSHTELAEFAGDAYAGPSAHQAIDLAPAGPQITAPDWHRLPLPVPSTPVSRC